ncbi:hypothetical protein NQ317_001291 [Molorchus minor]|uniref:Uncharacterized protein n=1 Tax=Molorchus minor TaxID=1323400 RepID=A0ABQ9JNI6_9CUCU|nr:hypothetical protein NQ317_001291 [Molorchus minor]
MGKKIRAQTEAKKAEKAEAEAKSENAESSSLLTEIPAGRLLSDVYLRHPANESSSDSEGEEAPFDDGIQTEADKTFRRVLQQQRDMQLKRAKEAEEKNKSKQNT